MNGPGKVCRRSMSIVRSTARRSTATSSGSPAATSTCATKTSPYRRASASRTPAPRRCGRCDFFCAAIRSSPRTAMSDFYITLAGRAELRARSSAPTSSARLSRHDRRRVLRRAAADREKYFDATHHCWAFRLRQRDAASTPASRLAPRASRSSARSKGRRCARRPSWWCAGSAA